MCERQKKFIFSPRTPKINSNPSNKYSDRENNHPKTQTKNRKEKYHEQKQKLKAADHSQRGSNHDVGIALSGRGAYDIWRIHILCSTDGTDAGCGTEFREQYERTAE